jgi:DNA (cytosine-5)-methyltransferase 1
MGRDDAEGTAVRRPLLIYLFGCEGGGAQGYFEAGFDVITVDNKPQRRLPDHIGFIQADATRVDRRLLAMADALHGSPPCQFGSELTPAGHRSKHLNLIPATRKLFAASGKPYVIENVRNVARAGHLIEPVSLFGTMFGNRCTDSQGRTFALSRERCFETNWGLFAPQDPGAQGLPIANVYGGHLRVRGGDFRTGGDTGRTVDLPGEDRQALARELMGMPWATMKGMSEAIPPSFTREIGRQLLAHLSAQRIAA